MVVEPAELLLFEVTGAAVALADDSVTITLDAAAAVDGEAAPAAVGAAAAELLLGLSAGYVIIDPKISVN